MRLLGPATARSSNHSLSGVTKWCASVTLLVVTLSLGLVPTSSAAGAGSSALVPENSSSYVSSSSFVDANEAEVQLGNQTARLQVGGQGQLRLKSAAYPYAQSFELFPLGGPSAATTLDDPLTVGCLEPPVDWAGTQDEWLAEGKRFECGDVNTVTITYDKPVLNPGLAIYDVSMSTTEDTLPEFGAIASWSETRISAINGESPTAYSTAMTTYETNPLAVPGVDVAYRDNGFTYTPPLGRKKGTAHDRPVVQISGLVHSVTLTVSYAAMVVIGPLAYDRFAVKVGRLPVRVGLVAPAIDLSVVKSAPTTVRTGDEIEWSMNVTNNSANQASHGYIVRDAIPATVVDPVLVSGPEGCRLAGPNLSCSAAPTGWSIDETDPDRPVLAGGEPAAAVPVVLEAGASAEPIIIRGTVTAPQSTSVENTATVIGIDSDPNNTNNVSTTTTAITKGPVWSIDKAASVAGGGTYVSPGENVSYTVTARSTEDTGNVVLTDDLTNVLNNATFVAGSATLTYEERTYLWFVPTGTRTVTKNIPDPVPGKPVLTSSPFTLIAGYPAKLTYTATVADHAWNSVLHNVVAGTGDTPPATCEAGAAPAPVCQTDTVVSARMDILKRGTVNGQVTPLDGAGFEILTDVDGVPGEPLNGITVSAVPGTTGSFEVLGITPGAYWIRESKAPDGHVLLAQAVPFTVAAGGALELANPALNSQVTIESGTLVVTDSPRFDMPATGGAGTGTLVAGGISLLSLALCAAFVSRRLGRRGKKHHDEMPGVR